MKKALLAACLLVLCMVFSAALAQETEPGIVVAFDKESVAVGEIITASYEITGADSLEELCGGWCLKTGDNWIDGGIGSFESRELTGSFSFAPAYGTELLLILDVVTGDGEYIHLETEGIPITGGEESIPPEVTITLDKATVAVGEMITADYEIAERDDIYRVNGSWVIWDADGDANDNFSTAELNGSSRFIPRYGGELHFVLNVEMISGRNYSFFSDAVAVTGDSSVAPEIAVYLEQESVAVGETITAYYEISGPAEIGEVYIDWIVWTDENSGRGFNRQTTDELSGEISFSPAGGKYVTVCVSAKTNSGREYNYESERIIVTGSGSSSGGGGAAAAPQVTITLDKDSVAVGETIIAAYEIAGDDTYVQIEGDWDVSVSENSGRSGLNSFETTQKSGSSSLKLSFGVAVQFRLTITDSNGVRYSFCSEEIPVTGDEPKPPQVVITLDKDAVAVGEAVTAVYEVTGDGEYTNVQGTWMIQSEENHWQSPGLDFQTAFLAGSSTCSPEFGLSLVLRLMIDDSDGRYYFFQSEEIPITGDLSCPPAVTISYNRQSVAKNQLITAAYSVEGSGPYRMIVSNWWMHSGNSSWGDECSQIRTTLCSGSSSFRPRAGESVSLKLSVEDVNGRTYFFEGASIPVTEEAAALLILPADLKEIRADAFAGASCTRVQCPEGLKSIAAGAFADCMQLVRIDIPSAETAVEPDAFKGCPDDLVIAAPEGSAAQQFAIENGYTFEAQ